MPFKPASTRGHTPAHTHHTAGPGWQAGTRRHALASLASLASLVTSALGLALAPSPSQAQAQAAAPWPSGQITLVVPFAPGSGTDSAARTVAQKLSARLGQPVLVDNKPGASAQLAAQHVAQAKPDGYTLFMSTNTAHSANPHLFKALRYEPIKDFTPITRVGELPFALAVHPSVTARTVPELIAYVKANPGKLSYATPNSTSLVAMETIKRLGGGLDITTIPYKASPQALTDLIGGQVQIYVVDLGSGLGTLKTDKVRVLAMTNARGSKLLPGVPPVATSLPGFDLTSWNGILGPAGLPKPIVDRLNTELLGILAEKDVQDKLSALGYEVWPSATPEVFATYLAEQLAHWGQMIRGAGIKPE